ncbi:MAG: sulfatase-like hydrolase/transferase, partial [Verrucomicrobiales bacterium]
MKPVGSPPSVPLVLLAAALAQAVHGQIVPGDVIGIDFGGNAQPNPAHWNLLVSPGDDVSGGSLVDITGSLVDGVAFTTTAPPSNTGENDDSTPSPSYSAFPENAQEDWWFENHTSGAFTFEFTGLDDSLTYDLVIGAYRSGATGVQIANGSTAWTAGGSTLTTVVDDADDSYVTFTGLSSSGGVLTIASGDNDGNTVGAVSALQLTAVGGSGDLGNEISIDFGANAPISTNWNPFSMTSSSTTVSNLVRRSDGAATPVGITVTGISGNGLNHLQGAGSADSSIYFDHIFAQNEDPDDTLTVTIFGLDDAQTYDLFGGFRRDLNRFEHVWTLGGEVRTNNYDGAVVDGYESFTGLSPSGGEITFTISDLDTADDWASIAELTITASEGFDAPPVAFDQSVRTEPDMPVDITLGGNQSGLSFTVASQPDHGTLTGTAPELTYDPSSGYTGDDEFTFTVSNGESTSAPATVSITVAENGPNFIIFLTDDQGYNDLGCYGSPHIQTPRIDAMAAEGIRFTSGYVPSPVCGPCRAGIFTGSYPIRIAEPNNAKNHHSEPHAEEIFIPELLKTAGYTSALIGKWHSSGEGTASTSLSATRGPVAQGFDYFYGTPSHNGVQAVDTGNNVNTSILRSTASGTTVVDPDLNQSEADQMILNYTNEALQFIENAHDANQPFFLKLSHNMPHVSLAARQSFRDSAALRGLDVYTAVVEELDWSMGQVLDKLDELEIADNTFVIFSSDNGPWTQANLEGYYGSAFPLRGSKMRSLEGGPRVPYIVRWPGTVTPGVVSDELVTLMDLFPTFMDYAGVEIPESLEIDGKSIRP